MLLIQSFIDFSQKKIYENFRGPPGNIFSNLVHSDVLPLRFQIQLK